MSLSRDGQIHNLVDLLTLPVGETGSLQQRLRQIAHAAMHIFSADYVSVLPLHPETRSALDPVVEPAHPHPPRTSQRAQHIVERGMLIVDSGAHLDELQEPFTTAAGIRTCVALPLRTRPSGIDLGVIYLDYREQRQFTPEEQRSLQAFADQASLALQQTWLLHRYAEVNRLGQAINSELTTVQLLFAKLRAGIADLLDCNYFFMLAVHQREHNTLDLYYAERGTEQHQLHSPFEGASAWVIDNQQPLLIQHLSANRAALPVAPVPIDDTESLEESLIYVPLIFRDRALGVLSVQHPEPNFYDEEDLQVLQLLGNQVALALNTIHLFDSLSQINQAGQTLVSELDLGLTALMQRVADLLRATVQADLVSLYPTDTQGQLLPDAVVSGVRFAPDHPRVHPPRQDDMALLALSHSTPTYARDSTTLFAKLGGDPTLQRGGFIDREQVQSTAVLPLRVGPVIAGVVFVNYRQSQRFDAFQRQVIESLANYAAIAIRNAGQYDAIIHNRIQELEALQKIDHALSASLDLQATLETIIRFAQERTRADEAAVILLNETTGTLECPTAVGVNVGVRRNWSVHPGDVKSIITWAFTERKTARAGDVHTESPWRELYDLVDPRVMSEMDVPLIAPDGTAVGVINLECFRAHAFGPEEERFIETLAGQAVLALRNAQAYEREQRVANEREALVEISKEIVRRLEPSDVFARILDQALNLTKAKTGTLHLYDAEHDLLRMVAQQGIDPAYLESAQTIKPGEGILGEAAARRSPARVDNVHEPPWNAYYLPYIPNVVSELVVPLMDGERLRGMLNLESTLPSQFTKRDEELLTAFAGMAVIAIQNAEHYAEAQHQSRRATANEQRMRQLYAAGRQLTAVTNELDAYTVVAQIAHDHFGCRVVGRRFRPETDQLAVVVEFGNRPEYPAFAMRGDQGLNGRVARERRTLVVDNIRDPRWETPRPLVTDPATRSVLITPVAFEQTYYGNLALSAPEAAAFQDADVALLEGLAQQLALTLNRLENTAAQLEAQQRVRDAEAMAAIGHAAYELTHRLGNDLGPITTSLNQIRRTLNNLGVENADIERHLNLIANDKEKVTRLVKRLKADVARDESELRVVVNILVRELLDETARSYPELPQGIQVQFDYNANIGEVYGDHRQITDILHNLFTNAVEALGDAGTITLRARETGTFIAIDVIDTGPGIPEARQERIFDLFHSTKLEGGGFGLWSARRNALANGGELTVTSTPGKGAIFTLSLPRATTPNEEAP
jgi:GAF domain-containing protein/anti-sigma regulatory factor (Ser/Thr protein kinase)